jgi:NAD(P)-dependent dehydrogenase (short-subunit alcohol dehydrogenase family)
MATSHPRVWLITGCASGFGAMLAQRVLDRGDCVAAADRSLAALDHLRCDDPYRLFPCKLDVADPDAVRLAVDAVWARFDEIDVLVNNAGIGLGGPFEEADWGAVHRLVHVNLLGAMAVAQAALPALRRRGRGRIINVSCESGLFGQPMQVAYSASKWGLEGFSEALAHEVARLGVRVALVEPCGVFRTPMPERVLADAEARLAPHSPYRPVIAGLLEKARLSLQQAQDPALVVDAVLRVADAPNPPLRTAVGPADRLALVAARRQMADETFIQLIRQNL